MFGINDYELLYMYHQKCEYALLFMWKKYAVRIHNEMMCFMSRNYLFPFEEELSQICYIKLVHSIECFREDLNYSFYTFYMRNVRNGFVDFLRAQRRYDTRIIDSIRIEDRVEEDEVMYIDHKSYEEEKQRLYWRQILEECCKCLTPFEQKFIAYRLKGYTYEQCANLLHVEASKINYTMRKIRKTLQCRIDEKHTL